MPDITSTSFGLVIAYLLPGLTGLLCFWFWSSRIQDVFRTFLKTESNVGLFLMVILAALTVGLMVTVVRWLIFERWWCRAERLQPTDFARLGTDQSMLDAFTAAVDAHYRYHQFWGGMAVLMPVLYASWVYHLCASCGYIRLAASSVAILLLEVITAMAATAAYRNYVARARHILQGSGHAQRME